MAAPPFVAYPTLTMANHKVLIVDESSTTRERLRELLPKGNYEIREASDGDAGLALIEQERSSVRFILLSSQVSQPSAWEIVHHLQADRDLYKVPLVLMTPDKPAALAQLAAPPAACELLETPFEKRQLQKAIKAAIAKAKAASSPTVPQDTYVPLPGLVSGPGTIDVEDWENAAAAPLAEEPAPQQPARDEADRDELAALAQAALAADEADPDRSEDFLLASSGLPAFLSGDDLANLPISRDIPLEEIDQQLAELGMPSGILDTSFDDDTLAPGDPFAVPPPEPELPLAPAASDEVAIPTELTAEAEQLWEEARELASDWPDPAADVTLSEAIIPPERCADAPGPAVSWELEPTEEVAAAASEEPTIARDERGIAADSDGYQFDFDSDFESREPAALDASEPVPAARTTWVQDSTSASVESEAEPAFDFDPLATVQQAEDEAAADGFLAAPIAAEIQAQPASEFSENAGDAAAADPPAADRIGWAIAADAEPEPGLELVAAVDDLPIEEAIARDDFFAQPEVDKRALDALAEADASDPFAWSEAEDFAPEPTAATDDSDPFAMPPDLGGLSEDEATTEEAIAAPEAATMREEGWTFEDPFATEVPDTLLPSLDEIADPFAELVSQEDALDRAEFAATEPLPGSLEQGLPVEAWRELEEVADPTAAAAIAPLSEETTAWFAAAPEAAQEAWAEEAAPLAAETPEVAGEDLAAATETVAWNADAASEATVAWSATDRSAADAPLAADLEAATAETVAWSESESKPAAAEAERLAAELSSDETALEVGAPLSTNAPPTAASAAKLNFQFDPDELADDDEYDDDHTVIEDRREVTTETVFATPATESIPEGLRLPEGVVTLGGFDDVLMRFHSQIEAERLSALRDALKCGKPGYELLLQAIKTETGAIQAEAERLVLERLQTTPLAYHTPEAERWLRLECVHILRGHSHWVQDVAIAPDGRTLVSGSKDGTLKIWDLLTGRETMTLHGHTSAVLSVALSPDGKQIASSSSDNTIRIWDCETGRQVRAIEGNRGHPIYVIAVSPDGQRIVSASADSNVKPKFDFSIDALLSRLPAETKSPLISTLKLLCRTQAIRVWNLASGKPEGTLVGYSRGLTDLRVSPDGELVIAGSRDQTIQIWEFKTGQLRGTLLGHTDEIRSVALSPDGRSLVSGSRDRTIKIWDLRTGHVLRTLRGHAQSVTSVAMSPDGQVVVSGSRDGTVRIWDFHTGQHLHTLFGHADLVRAIAVSADGTTIVSGSRDRTVRVWQTIAPS